MQQEEGPLGRGQAPAAPEGKSGQLSFVLQGARPASGLSHSLSLSLSRALSLARSLSLSRSLTLSLCLSVSLSLSLARSLSLSRSPPSRAISVEFRLGCRLHYTVTKPQLNTKLTKPTI